MFAFLYLLFVNSHTEFMGFDKLNYYFIIKTSPFSCTMTDKTAVLVTDAYLGYHGLKEEYAGHAVNHSQKAYKRYIFYTKTVE